MSYLENMQSQENPGTEQHPIELSPRLMRALEHAPQPAIPTDFAAKVAASLPALKPARKPLRLSRTVSLISLGVLTVAMFILARYASPSFTSIAFDFELVLIAQMAAIGYWMTVKAER